MNSPDKFRILYAEDNEDACVMVTVMLKFDDIIVTCAKSVAEAIRLAQTEHFDLFLLDSRFPDGSGLDLCRHLHEFYSQIPILFYSGNAFPADRQNGLAAGATDYLIKPYTENLGEKILKTIEHSQKSVTEIALSSLEKLPVNANKRPFYYS